MAVLSSSAYLTYRITPPSRVVRSQVAISRNGAERNGTELKSKIRNGTGLTERSFSELYSADKKVADH